MREWKIKKLEEFDISNHRYMELRSFCEQYPEWKQFLLEHDGSVGAMQYSDMPKSHNTDSSVEKIAIKRAKFSQKTDIVEKCARETSKEYETYIIRHVCYGESVNYLINMAGMAESRATFYRLRRKFYYLLDKMKN